ncbi:MAG: hypothetical protein JRG97_07450 [Deltaproteobacteria bacterium]|nr:hypothetical protein [Deltaproteobacteria bacterium]MBW2051434.1 hypothetical protein [Deltaproteobacteria bacterium]MBW2140893.1 hypothetical protein [Deltaproteobacteria bacterium]MBW2323348.1 hypothetical protein [Deltaproteobacteria bacterium]
MEIVIEAGNLKVEAELFDTATARAIYSELPLEVTALTWGDEIYFEIPVSEKLDETAREVVQVGDLGYWPTGNALCIFFGPTPISGPGEIRPASAVNIVGRVRGEAERFKEVPAGSIIKVDPA